MSETLSRESVITAYDDMITDGEMGVPFTDADLTTGYLVGSTPKVWALPPDVPFDGFAGAIEQIRIMYPDADAAYGTVCAVGHWHVKPIQRITERERAEYLARVRKQKTIYDLTADREVWI